MKLLKKCAAVLTSLAMLTSIGFEKFTAPKEFLTAKAISVSASGELSPTYARKTR